MTVRTRAAGTWLALLALVGCRAPQREAPARPDPVPAIDAFLQAALEARQIPGLALVAMRGDEVLAARGYGYTDGRRTAPVSADTVFQLGSISKQFLAALVVRLAEKGAVGLDDSVSQRLPSFDHLPPAIRVRHLLTHTSGIREIFTLPPYQAGIEDLSRTADELTAILRQAPVDFPAGARWAYSNANYQLLALLVEAATGMAYEQALAREFFEPLGLASLRHCTPLPRDAGEARGHVLAGTSVAAAAPENMNWIRGDGGLCGSARDVARWFRLLTSGRVLPPESYRAMSTPARLADGRDVDYGFALSLVPLDGRRKVAHNGAMLGFSASAAHYPDDGLTVVVLTNRGDVRTESLERGVARQLLGLPAPAYAAQALDAETKQRFAGRYDIGVFPMRVVDRGDRLWLEMPKPGPTTPLRYLGGGEFVSEEEPDAYALRFPAGSGPAREVRLSMAAMHWYGVRLP